MPTSPSFPNGAVGRWQMAETIKLPATPGWASYRIHYLPTIADPTITGLVMEPNEKAARILERVARAVGATQIRPDIYILTTPKGTFHIDSHYIQWRASSDPVRYAIDFDHITCYRTGSLPWEEKIATALLRLKNNPEQFTWLRDYPGYMTN